jgi:hypothetical protein
MSTSKTKYAFHLSAGPRDDNLAINYNAANHYFA